MKATPAASEKEVCLIHANKMKAYLPEEVQLLAERQAAFFRIFGHPQRVLILWLLAEREYTVNEIALAIGASPAATLHHLRILGFSKLVESQRGQGNIYYHLADNEVLRNCLVYTNRPKDTLMEINPSKFDS